MNIVVIAALIQAFIAFGVAIFQIALVAGAPLGEYTMGGQHPGKLPGQFRVTAAVSAIIMVAQSGHYLAQAGILNPALSPGQNAIVNWFWFGFAVLVTRPHSTLTYDGQQLVCVDIAEDVTGSALVAAWLKRAQLTKPAQLFVDYCKEQFRLWLA